MRNKLCLMTMLCALMLLLPGCSSQQAEVSQAQTVTAGEDVQEGAVPVQDETTEARKMAAKQQGSAGESSDTIIEIYIARMSNSLKAVDLYATEQEGTYGCEQRYGCGDGCVMYDVDGSRIGFYTFSNIIYNHYDCYGSGLKCRLTLKDGLVTELRLLEDGIIKPLDASAALSPDNGASEIGGRTYYEDGQVRVSMQQMSFDHTVYHTAQGRSEERDQSAYAMKLDIESGSATKELYVLAEASAGSTAGGNDSAVSVQRLDINNDGKNELVIIWDAYTGDASSYSEIRAFNADTLEEISIFREAKAFCYEPAQGRRTFTEEQEKAIDEIIERKKQSALMTTDWKGFDETEATVENILYWAPSVTCKGGRTYIDVNFLAKPLGGLQGMDTYSFTARLQYNSKKGTFDVTDLFAE